MYILIVYVGVPSPCILENDRQVHTNHLRKEDSKPIKVDIRIEVPQF